jgi:hypothetical protein
VSALWADVPGLSARERCRLAAWQQHWEQVNCLQRCWPGSVDLRLCKSFRACSRSPPASVRNIAYMDETKASGEHVDQFIVYAGYGGDAGSHPDGPKPDSQADSPVPWTLRRWTYRRNADP